MKQLAILIISVFAFSQACMAQSNGSISGYVFDSLERNTIPGAHVYIETQNGKIGAVTDSIGYYSIKPINPGRYTLNISYVGYQELAIENISVRSDFNTHIGNIYLPIKSLPETIIIGHVDPLIDREGGCLVYMNHKKIAKLPEGNNLMAVLEVLTTEFQVSENRQEVFFRGSRANMTAYIIDGVRVDNLNVLPNAAVGNLTVYAGGIPAKYGDFNGGVVVVETLSYFDWLQNRRARDRAYRESQILE